MTLHCMGSIVFGFDCVAVFSVRNSPQAYAYNRVVSGLTDDISDIK